MQPLEIGEFVFRPSSRGPDNLTLTWKFYMNNIVHLDITELDKAVGATIGSRLRIGANDELFENLQEIVERHIVPCNKFLRDAISHVKFLHCDSSEQLEVTLKAEKTAEPTRIPYRITVLPEYPQTIVLGYIPKQSLVRDYIKV